MRNVAPIEVTSKTLLSDLSSTDRRLLLRASLVLFLRRLNHNIPVLRDDLLRLAYYAPDEAEQS